MNTKEEFIEYIMSHASEFSSPKDHSVFYSGESYTNYDVYLNKDRAFEFIENNDTYTTIETTKGGHLLQNVYENFERQDANKITSTASQQYAALASGEVRTFVVDASENGIFRSIELPILLDNEKVTSINGVDREELKTLYDRNPEAAYNKVCEAELQRDRTIAEDIFDKTGDSRSLDDVEHREKLYQDQIDKQAAEREIKNQINEIIPEFMQESEPEKTQEAAPSVEPQAQNTGHTLESQHDSQPTQTVSNEIPTAIQSQEQSQGQENDKVGKQEIKEDTPLPSLTNTEQSTSIQEVKPQENSQPTQATSNEIPNSAQHSKEQSQEQPEEKLVFRRNNQEQDRSERKISLTPDSKQDKSGEEQLTFRRNQQSNDIEH